MYDALHEVEPSKCLNEWMKVTQLSHQLVDETGENDLKRKEIKGENIEITEAAWGRGGKLEGKLPKERADKYLP